MTLSMSFMDIFVLIMMEYMNVFWEKFNKSLGIPCTRRDTKKCIPLACREDERGAVRGHEDVTFVEIW